MLDILDLLAEKRLSLMSTGVMMMTSVNESGSIHAWTNNDLPSTPYAMNFVRLKAHCTKNQRKQKGKKREEKNRRR